MHQIHSNELYLRLETGEALNLVDVREEIEYHTYNIGGVNIPLSKLENNLHQLACNKDDEVIVICKAGLRSRTAQAILKEHGYQRVRNLQGGLLALQRLIH